MSIQEFCETNIVTIAASSSLQSASKLMGERSVGFLVVTNAPGEPVGVLTDRDIVVRGVAENLVMNLATVSSVMTEKIISVPESSSVATAVQVMREHHVRRLVLMAPDGKIYGVVSQDDLIFSFGRDIKDLSDVCFAQNGTKSRHRTHEYTSMA